MMQDLRLCGRELLAAPLEEAKELLKGRFPVPKLLDTDQGGSQVRVRKTDMYNG